MERIKTIHEYREMVIGVCDRLRELCPTAYAMDSLSLAISGLQKLPDELIEIAKEGGALEYDEQDEVTKNIVSDVLRGISKYCANSNFSHWRYLEIKSVISDAPFDDQQYVDWHK